MPAPTHPSGNARRWRAVFAGTRPPGEPVPVRGVSERSTGRYSILSGSRTAPGRNTAAPTHPTPDDDDHDPTVAGPSTLPPLDDPTAPALIHAADLPEPTEANQRPTPTLPAWARPDPAPPSAAKAATQAAPRPPGWWARWRHARAAAREQRQRHPSARDLPFIHSVRAAQVQEARPGINLAIWLMVLGVALAAGWAATTHVEQITRADARVVPEGREQVIASLEGGLLAELLVSEGAQVTPGQALVRLDPTRFEAQQSEGQAKRLALLAGIARLRAEANGQALAFDPVLRAQARLTDAETEAFQARRRLLDESLAAYRHSIGLVQQELDVSQRMAAQGLVSELEVVRLRRQINDMRQQMLERGNRFRQEASTELLARQSELAQLEEQMVARDDAVRRTLITSPVRGLVKNIRVNTVGGVIGAGTPIMEIVPLGDKLRVEARIKPADIGFVRVGQTAQVKLSAYDANLHGQLSGQVVSLSPDALGDPERANGGPDATFYRAIIRIERNTLQASGQPLPVIPGMNGAVEINTGQRSVLDFILRPMLKAKEAFRER